MMLVFILIALLFTKVEAEELEKLTIEPKNIGTTNSAINIHNDMFYPYKINETNIFFCIQRFQPYVANLPDRYKNPENQTHGEWCTICDEEVEYPTKDGGGDWNGGAHGTETMEYVSDGHVNYELYQDAAYVFVRAKEEGYIDAIGKIAFDNFNIGDYPDINNEVQKSLWHTTLNEGRHDVERGKWNDEADEYLKHYKSIHNSTTDDSGNLHYKDVYTSKVSDETNKQNVKVQVNQTDKTYIVGPFKVDYLNNYYGNRKFSYIKNIYLLDKRNAQIGNVSDNNIQLLTADGLAFGEEAEWINANNELIKSSKKFPEPNQEFYVKFSSQLGEGDIQNIKLKVEFEYLESCYVTLEKFKGTSKKWVWQKEATNKTCQNPTHPQGKDDTLYTWRLKTEIIETEPQKLVSYGWLEEGNLAKGETNRIIRNANIILAPDSINLTMELSGKVFLDADSGKINEGNNMLDSEENLSGIEVTLYDAATDKVVTQTNTVIRYDIHNTTVEHKHIGDPEMGGGCYTKPNHEHLDGNTPYHIGSMNEPGICYSEPYTHIHSLDGGEWIDERNGIGGRIDGEKIYPSGCYINPVYYNAGTGGTGSSGHERT